MADRDKNGRFLPGKSGNPAGRNKRAEEDRFLDVIRSAVTEEMLSAAWAAVGKKAGRGDTAAAKLLFSYLHGNPDQAIDLRQDGRLEISINYVNDND